MRTGFLDSFHFVGPGGGSRLVLPSLPLVVAVLLLLDGCAPERSSQTVEDSLTSGRIRLACAPEAAVLVRRELEGFQTMYPQASFDFREAPSGDAVRALFADQADLAVITRELEPEERAAAVRGRLELEGFPFARDGVVVLANPANPIENLTIEDLRDIYAGRVADWKVLGSQAGKIVPVIPPPQSDLTAFFAQKVMNGEDLHAAAEYALNDSDVVKRVLADRGAIGFASLGVAPHGARVLRLAALKGLPYWKPDLEAVYRGDYPLTRFFNLYVRTAGKRLAHGVITWTTSMDGQALVKDAGLVPTAVPVRFVRRSPMLSTH